MAKNKKMFLKYFNTIIYNKISLIYTLLMRLLENYLLNIPVLYWLILVIFIIVLLFALVSWIKLLVKNKINFNNLNKKYYLIILYCCFLLFLLYFRYDLLRFILYFYNFS